MKKFLGWFLCLMLGATMFGADLYVSQSVGKKKGPGTKDAPFKAIADAVKKAEPGDTISTIYRHVFEAIRRGVPYRVKVEESVEVVRVADLVRQQNPRFRQDRLIHMGK